jgi:hypothetical protein
MSSENMGDVMTEGRSSTISANPAMAMPQPFMAAVVFKKGEPVDRVLEDVVVRLRRTTLRLAGYLQRTQLEADSCCTVIDLEHIPTGRFTIVSQPLGAGSQGCRLDAGAFAELAGSLVAEIGQDTDLLIVNRWGYGETEGQGFRAAIEKAFERGVPVLIAVRDENLANWRDFSGEFSTTLPLRTDAIVDWVARVVNGDQRGGGDRAA